MSNFTMICIWLRYFSIDCQICYWSLRTSIVRICLSMLAQIFCKVIIIYLWVHPKAIPKCGIVQNLSWHHAHQDTTRIHTSSYILRFRSFVKPDFFGPVKESHNFIPSYLIPKWVNLVMFLYHMKCLSFLNVFTGWIPEKFDGKFLSRSICFLIRLYPYFSAVLTILGCA